MIFRKNILLVLLLVLVAGLAGCAAKNGGEKESMRQWMDRLENGGETREPSEHLELARGWLGDGAPDEALFHAEEALDARPEDSEALYLKAESLRRLGRHEEAAGLYRDLLDNNPRSDRAHLGLGRSALALEMHEQAASHLAKAAELGGHWRSWLYLGVAASGLQDHGRAESAFRQALALRSNQSETLNNLGVCLLMQDRPAEAAKVLSRALRHGEGNPSTYNNLGLALARQGRLEEALEAFKASGGEAEAHNNLGYVLYLQGEYAAAERHLNRAVDVSPVYYPTAAENLKKVRLARASRETGVAGVPAEVMPSSAPAAAVSRSRVKKAAAVEREAAAEVSNASVVRPTPLPQGKAEPEGRRVEVARVEAKEARRSEQTKEVYAYLLSSWQTIGKAMKVREKLAERGGEVWVRSSDLGEKGVWHRVMAGSYASRERAEAARGNLDLPGMESAILMRVERKSRLKASMAGRSL
ncbi:SPOR domain-containing protein [Desulfohalovibrio reitneri]|uniref:SPOR domain-containing protein n=1 Tax=Desulfohalovibrio reitneri TaxID=1307759 RepID=UPI0004A70038|nr:tetratricopeptide repeat protein [Desulfohalovibrio reitneri]